MVNYVAVALFYFISVGMTFPTGEQNMVRVWRAAFADPHHHHGHNDGYYSNYGGFRGEYGGHYSDYLNYPYSGYSGNLYPHGGYGNVYPNGGYDVRQGLSQSSANAQKLAGTLDGQIGPVRFGGSGGSYAQANAQAHAGSFL